MSLAGRTALITGASQGLGAAIAERFLAEGADVALCGRTADDLDAQHKRLAAAYGADRVWSKPADVSSKSDVDALFDETQSRFGRLDILVNNAGVYGPMGSIDTVDWDEWVQAIAINLTGAVYCARKAVAIFKPQRRGKIIILSGGGATSPLPGISAYAASKAAIVRFAETLALETREWNIDVNAIAPGALMTRLTDQLIAAGPEKRGRGVACAHDQAQAGRRHTACAGCGPLQLSGQRRKRRPDGTTYCRAMGPLAVYRRAPSGDRGIRHLYAAPDRAWGSRKVVGGPLNAVDNHRLRPDRLQAGRGRAPATRSSRSAIPIPSAGKSLRMKPRRARLRIGARPLPLDTDAVVVATPHDQLARIALAAVEAGRHVLVEKPAGRRRRGGAARCRSRKAQPHRQGRLQPPLPPGDRKRARRWSTRARSVR